MTGTLAVGKKKPKINPHRKKLVSFKLTESARGLVETLSEKMGVDKTAVIEIAVRKLFEIENLGKDEKKIGKLGVVRRTYLEYITLAGE